MSGHVHNTNEACCSIPPVQSDYSSKGSYERVGEFDKAYVTGSSKTHALICVYDIFGYWPQTEQGADILASSITSKPRVIMPDFFGGKPWPVDDFPPKTDEGKQKLQEFFGGIASPPANLERLVKLAQTLKGEGYQHIGVYGFCWGGKVSVLSGSKGAFDAIAIVHPAMLSVDDVKDLSVPLAMYPSKDEPADEAEKIVEALKSKPFADQCTHKTYSDMHHGWAAARADLKDPQNKKQYEDVYSRLAGFFDKIWA